MSDYLSGGTSTQRLSGVMLRRAMMLLRVALRTRDTRDVYRAVGMASELIDDADKILCTLPDSELFGSQKTFEELTGKRKSKARAASPLALAYAFKTRGQSCPEWMTADNAERKVAMTILYPPREPA